MSSNWRSQIFGEKIFCFAAQIWAKWAKIVFTVFSGLVFLEIAYNDSLQEFLTSIRGITHEKSFLGPDLGQNRSWN